MGHFAAKVSFAGLPLKRIAIIVFAVLLLLAGGFHIHQFLLVHAQSTEPGVHKENSFDLLISQPYERVAPLFGANGERAWGGADWDPHFVYPNPPQDRPGAVFTVDHGGHKSLWVTPVYDLENHHIQHLIIMPDLMVTQLDITFPERFPNETKVHVVYQRTALSSTLNDHVGKLSEEDALKGPDWQKAIEEYFGDHKKP